MPSSKEKPIPAIDSNVSRRDRRSRSPRVKVEPDQGDQVQRYPPVNRDRSPSIHRDDQERGRRRTEEVKYIKEEVADQDLLNAQLGAGTASSGENQETTDQGYDDAPMEPDDGFENVARRFKEVGNYEQEYDEQEGDEGDEGDEYIEQDEYGDDGYEGNARDTRYQQHRGVEREEAGDEETAYFREPKHRSIKPESSYQTTEDNDQFVSTLSTTMEGLERAVQKKYHLPMNGKVFAYRNMGQGKFQVLVSYINHNGAVNYRMEPGAGYKILKTAYNLPQHQRGNLRDSKGKPEFYKHDIHQLKWVAWQPKHENPLQTIHPHAWRATNNPPQVYCCVAWLDGEQTVETRSTMRRLLGRQGADYTIFELAEDQEHRWIGTYSGIEQFYQEKPLDLLTARQREARPKVLPKPPILGQEAALEMQANNVVKYLQKHDAPHDDPRPAELVSGIAREGRTTEPIGRRPEFDVNPNGKKVPIPYDDPRLAELVSGIGREGRTTEPIGRRPEFDLNPNGKKVPLQRATTTTTKSASRQPELGLDSKGKKIKMTTVNEEHAAIDPTGRRAPHQRAVNPGVKFATRRVEFTPDPQGRKTPIPVPKASSNRNLGRRPTGFVSV